jgi:hypothetical protein
MGSPTSFTTENLEPRRKGRASSYCSKGTLLAIDGSEAYYADERLSRGIWPSEAPPTGVLTGVLGEISFFYGAYWLHHRSAQRQGKMR